MANVQEAVRRLRIESSITGDEQTVSGIKRIGDASDQTVSRLSKLEDAYDRLEQQTKDYQAANDNVARNMQAASDSNSDFGRSLADVVASTISTVNHLKLLGLGAYALVPAFRSFVNAQITSGMQLIGGHLNILVQAFTRLLNVAGPALSFFSRIAVPIGIAVAAWQTLNAVISRGADLLEQYGTSGTRKLFDDPNLVANLEKLTKFQQDIISPQQVQQATELATRLETAKNTLAEFAKVQLDLTNPALKLQSVWVRTVELLAQATTLLGQMPEKTQSALTAIGNASFWKYLTIPGSSTPGMIIQEAPPPVDNSDAMRLARGRLAVGLGGGFSGRFNNAISDLANPPKPEEQTTARANAYDRAVQTIKDQIDLLNLEAQGVGKTSQEYQELKVSHELTIAAMKAGIEVTDDMRQKWKEYAAQIAEATLKLNQARVLQEQQFRGATQFMSPSQQAAAQAARQIDPTNWQARLNDAGPRMAAFNEQLRQAADLSANFLDTFNQGLLQGKSRTEALANALKSLESQLLQIASRQAINYLFQGLFNLAGVSGVLPGGAPIGQGGIGHAAQGEVFNSGNIVPFARGGVIARPINGGMSAAALGEVFNSGNIVPFARGGVIARPINGGMSAAALGEVFNSGNIVPFDSGGVVTGPTLFPMARGMGLMGEAGPEAVMPLRRGADGKLGIAGGGTAVNMQVVINNNSANDVDVNPRRESGPDGERLVIEIVKKAHARGEFDPSNSSLYGLRRRKVR
jgi:hypothetical protein